MVKISLTEGGEYIGEKDIHQGDIIIIGFDPSLVHGKRNRPALLYLIMILLDLHDH